jgi:hypothetical protein
MSQILPAQNSGVPVSCGILDITPVRASRQSVHLYGWEVFDYLRQHVPLGK